MRFGTLVRHYNSEARAGRSLPFVIRSGGRLVGQMHLFGIAWGSLLSCAAGYWVTESAAGRGIAPTALACAGDYALGEPRASPDRGEHPAGERREPRRGAQARIP